MANKIISNLTPKTSPAAADVLAIEDTEATKKIDYNALADAILNKITSKTYSVAGSTQTLISAIDALNSKLVNVFDQTGGNITASNIDSLKTPAIYNRYIEAISITGDSAAGNHFGLLIVSNAASAERVGQYIFMPQTGYIASRFDSNGTWSVWRGMQLPVIPTS